MKEKSAFLFSATGAIGHGSDGQFYWHGSDGQFYWHGSADNAYEARYKGWGAWLRKRGLDVDGSTLTEVEI